MGRLSRIRLLLVAKGERPHISVAARIRGRDFSDADVARAARAPANDLGRARRGGSPADGVLGFFVPTHQISQNRLPDDRMEGALYRTLLDNNHTIIKMNSE
jgi:hypothetical protein